MTTLKDNPARELFYKICHIKINCVCLHIHKKTSIFAMSNLCTNFIVISRY